MRRFQRAAVVAAAFAGLSAFGAGVSFAGGYDDVPQGITAVANSSANAVATAGGYNYGQPQAQPEGDKTSAPEEGYGQYAAPEGDK
ncbi:hypothetical protein ABZ471_48650 [Streptomyces sp. NPDC005728]|uniref:hypothetical protein n=1 Tax=Streptomyces sp. NPDC005728 TaxID=3157054 RepID=UPI0033FF5A18